MKPFTLIQFQPYILGALGGVLGVILLPLTGIFNSSADPDRWAPGDWFAYLSARQSVTLRSLGMSVPDDLDNPDRVRRAAGHYELVCADCHGSPTRPAAQIAQNLVPAPPDLTERMEQWRPDARVFWTIKHGIRGSAMPAWPTQMRDDEVWDMVAFLRALPEQDASTYPVAATCSSCHGEGGKAGIPGIPRLDIQSPAYLEAALKSYRDDLRHSGPMQAATRTLSNADIATLAQHFGQATPAEPTTGEGSTIALSGIPERDIPACDACHGSSARPDYPRLAGQDRDYLFTQLKLFIQQGSEHHATERGGPRAQIMAQAAKNLSEDEAKMLADHYGR